MAYSIDIINTICTDLGGIGGHKYEIDALNEICSLVGATTGHKYNIDALNAICASMGYSAGHKYNIDALNAIYVGGTYIYEDDAWQAIQIGSKLNLPPVYSDVIVYLDGTITQVESDYYFVDKKSGKNFLITDYDFPKWWTDGIPYKSAATISAPAEDADLIAADVNNFLYAIDGTPNLIPVVSLFQDIDYEHKIFAKHESQIIAITNEEIAPPYVSKIVIYSTTKNEEDLTRCQTYFNVPVENLSAKWVAKAGNDTTGDGSKLNPWLTLNKAALSIEPGTTVYCKSGSYAETYAGYGFLLRKTSSFYGIGKCIITPGAGASGQVVLMDGNQTVTFEGFKVTGALNYSFITTKGAKTINRCLFDNSLVQSVYATAGMANITNCVCKNSGILNNTAGITSGNLILTVGNKYTFTSTNNVLFKYNDIKPTGASTRGWALDCASNLTTIEIFGNNFYLSALPGQRIYYGQSGYTQILKVNYNYVYSTAIITASTISAATDYVGTIEVSNNRMIYTNTGDFNTTSISPITLVNQVAPIISKNIIELNTPYNLYAIDVRSAGNMVGDAVISDNLIKTVALQGHVISVGSENSGAYDDKITPLIVNNRVIGPYDVGVTEDGSALHTIFCGHVLNPVITHNRVSGCGIGIVLKHENNGVYTSDSIHSNLIINCNYGFVIKGVDGAKIYNNTIKSSLQNSYGIHFSPHALETNQAKNITSKNNIYDIAGYAVYSIPTGCGEGFVSDNNVMHCDVAAILSDVSKNIEEWQELGYDTNSVVLSEAQYNDLFNDTANNNLSLQSGSAAIGAGIALDAAYDDGLDASTDWGNDTETPTVIIKQQNAAWDCGAYVH